VADIFTKTIPIDRFRRLRIMLGVKMLLGLRVSVGSGKPKGAS